MKILAEMPTGMGSKWVLAEFKNDFYGYGTVSDFNNKLGLPVNQCGTKKEVQKHCKNIEKTCIKHIKDYKENFNKTKEKGWEILIEHEQKKLDMLRKFIYMLTD